MLGSLIKPNPNSRKSPLGVSKKIKKPRKPEKNNRKNWTVKKNRLNRLKFWKNRPVWLGFGFISLKPKKLNRTEPKPKKTGKKTESNRAKTEKLSQTGFCPKKTEPNRNRSVWTDFSSVSVFLKKNSVWLFFFIKTEPNKK